MMSDDNRLDFPKASANDATRQMPTGPAAKPELLKVPEAFQSVEGVLATAGKLDLPNVLVLSDLDNGNLLLLHHGMNKAEMNFLVDRLKLILLGAVDHERVGK